LFNNKNNRHNIESLIYCPVLCFKSVKPRRRIEIASNNEQANTMVCQPRSPSATAAHTLHAPLPINAPWSWFCAAQNCSRCWSIEIELPWLCLSHFMTYFLGPISTIQSGVL